MHHSRLMTVPCAKWERSVAKAMRYPSSEARGPVRTSAASPALTARAKSRMRLSSPPPWPLAASAPGKAASTITCAVPWRLGCAVYRARVLVGMEMSALETFRTGGIAGDWRRQSLQYFLPTVPWGKAQAGFGGASLARSPSRKRLPVGASPRSGTGIIWPSLKEDWCAMMPGKL